MVKSADYKNSMESEEKYKRIFDNAIEMILVVQNSIVKLHNPIFAKLTGYSNDELVDANYWNFVHVDERRFVINQYVKRLNDNAEDKICSFKLLKKDGTYIWVKMNLIKIEWDGNDATLFFLSDITEQKNRENKILYLSYNDQLTGLYNRRFYQEELLRLDTERNLPLSIVMADVNCLKLTNDAFGHLAGDKLLQEVSKAMKSECRADDIIARFGGDEFIILLPKTNYEETSTIVKRICEYSNINKSKNSMLSVSFGWATKYYKHEKINLISIQAEDNMYRNKLTESDTAKRETIKLIFKNLYGKNKEEERHSKNVSNLCEKLAIELGMNEKFIHDIKLAGLMHDIGKIAINKNILEKSGLITDSEKLEIKKHAEVGYHILKSVCEYSSIAECVVSHHERLDGKGYPKGLKSKDIPYSSKIIAVVEAYDVMTNDNSYKKSLSQDEAIRELIKNAYVQFDFEIIKVFVEKVLKCNLH